MKKFLKKTLSVVTAISLFATFPFTVIADEVPAASEYDLVEYDYVNKTERIISADEIFDYSATTTTTYELNSMKTYVANLEKTASTYTIIDKNSTYEQTSPVGTNGQYVSPYSGVVCLLIGVDTSNDGITDNYAKYVATGFMVAPDVMITAAHNFVSDEDNEAITSVRIFAGWHGEDIPTASSQGYVYPQTWIMHSNFEDYYTNTDLYRSEYLNYDWCVVKLQNEIEGVYNFNCTYTYNITTNTSVIASGYPLCATLSCGNNDCSHNQGYLITSWGQIDIVNDLCFSLTNNLKDGHSGGPIYISYYGYSNVCCGIISTGYDDYNVGTRIVEYVYNIIANYIEQ